MNRRPHLPHGVDQTLEEVLVFLPNAQAGEGVLHALVRHPLGEAEPVVGTIPPVGGNAERRNSLRFHAQERAGLFNPDSVCLRIRKYPFGRRWAKQPFDNLAGRVPRVGRKSQVVVILLRHGLLLGGGRLFPVLLVNHVRHFVHDGVDVFSRASPLKLPTRALVQHFRRNRSHAKVHQQAIPGTRQGRSRPKHSRVTVRHNHQPLVREEHLGKIRREFHRRLHALHLGGVLCQRRGQRRGPGKDDLSRPHRVEDFLQRPPDVRRIRSIHHVFLRMLIEVVGNTRTPLEVAPSRRALVVPLHPEFLLEQVRHGIRVFGRDRGTGEGTSRLEFRFGEDVAFDHVQLQLRPYIRQTHTHRQVGREKKRTLRRIGNKFVLDALPAGKKVAAKADALFGGCVHVHSLELLPRFAQAHELRVEVECPGRFFRIPRQFPKHNRLRQTRLTFGGLNFNGRGFDGLRFDRRNGRLDSFRRSIFLFDLRLRPLVQRQLKRRRGHAALNRTAESRTHCRHLSFAPQIVKGRLRLPAEFPVQPLHDSRRLLPGEVPREERANRTNCTGIVPAQDFQQWRESEPLGDVFRKPVYDRVTRSDPWSNSCFSLFGILPGPFSRCHGRQAHPQRLPSRVHQRNPGLRKRPGHPRAGGHFRHGGKQRHTPRRNALLKHGRNALRFSLQLLLDFLCVGFRPLSHFRIRARGGRFDQRLRPPFNRTQPPVRELHKRLPNKVLAGLKQAYLLLCKLRLHPSRDRFKHVPPRLVGLDLRFDKLQGLCRFDIIIEVILLTSLTRLQSPYHGCGSLLTQALFDFVRREHPPGGFLCRLCGRGRSRSRTPFRLAQRLPEQRRPLLYLHHLFRVDLDHGASRMPFRQRDVSLIQRHRRLLFGRAFRFNARTRHSLPTLGRNRRRHGLREFIRLHRRGGPTGVRVHDRRNFRIIEHDLGQPLHVRLPPGLRCTRVRRIDPGPEFLQPQPRGFRCIGYFNLLKLKLQLAALGGVRDRRDLGLEFLQLHRAGLRVPLASIAGIRHTGIVRFLLAAFPPLRLLLIQVGLAPFLIRGHPGQARGTEIRTRPHETKAHDGHRSEQVRVLLNPAEHLPPRLLPLLELLWSGRERRLDVRHLLRRDGKPRTLKGRLWLHRHLRLRGQREGLGRRAVAVK